MYMGTVGSSKAMIVLSVAIFHSSLPDCNPTKIIFLFSIHEDITRPTMISNQTLVRF